MGNLTINLGYQILILHILGFWPVREGVTKVLARCVLVAVSQFHSCACFKHQGKHYSEKVKHRK